MTSRSEEADGPEQLHRVLLERWNKRDSAGFAALFEPEGHSVGFDGSEMHGPAEIESTLEQIFADHETPSCASSKNPPRRAGTDIGGRRLCRFSRALRRSRSCARSVAAGCT
jgi:hypothetical protein